MVGASEMASRLDGVAVLDPEDMAIALGMSKLVTVPQYDDKASGSITLR
jgi:hypothetical protein